MDCDHAFNILGVVLQQRLQGLGVAPLVTVPELDGFKTIHTFGFAGDAEISLNPLLAADDAVALAYPAQIDGFILIPKVDGKALAYDIQIKAMAVVGYQATGLGKFLQKPSSADLTPHQLDETGRLRAEADDRNITIPIGFDVEIDVQ